MTRRPQGASIGYLSIVVGSGFHAYARSFQSWSFLSYVIAPNNSHNGPESVVHPKCVNSDQNGGLCLSAAMENVGVPAVFAFISVVLNENERPELNEKKLFYF